MRGNLADRPSREDKAENLDRFSLSSEAPPSNGKQSIFSHRQTGWNGCRILIPFAGQGTLIRFASFNSGITDPDQEKFHAFQTCYLGSRGRLVVRSDCNRIGADRPGAAGPRRIS
jgi:hypothetical protein